MTQLSYGDVSIFHISNCLLFFDDFLSGSSAPSLENPDNQQIEIERGTEIFLECRDNAGRPKPQIRWFKTNVTGEIVFLYRSKLIDWMHHFREIMKKKSKMTAQNTMPSTQRMMDT